MRATRAFVGAFGAGISLAIAGSLALLVVSSVIAFKGWPDDLKGSSEPEIARLSDASSARPGGAGASVALPKAVASTAAAGRGRVSSRHGGSVRSGASVAGTTAGGTSSTVSSTASAPSSSASAPASSAPGGTSKTTSPVHQVSNAVRDTTKTVGDAVAPVSPAVGGALQSVGAAGADTVDQVGQTVDKVAGGVLP